jgi:hypothetical protein
LSVIKIYISRLKKVFPNNNYYDSYLEYENPEDFKQWILSLKPKDVRDKGISERGLRNFKQKIKSGRGLKNKSKIARILFEYYKSKSTAQ